MTYYSEPHDAAIRHHHCLALVTPSQREPLNTVIAYLERELGQLASREEWLTVLDQVTAAPNRLRTTRDPRDFVTTLAGVADPRSRTRTVSRLAVARWLYNDRCFDPSHRLARLIANEYDYLAEQRTDSEALYQQSTKYRRIESHWEG
jgi:hypothetical protein